MAERPIGGGDQDDRVPGDDFDPEMAELRVVVTLPVPLAVTKALAAVLF